MKRFLPKFYKAARLRVQGMSYRQIGAEMEISLTMGAVLISRARAAGLKLPTKHARLGVDRAALPLVHSTANFDADSWWAARGY